MSEWTNDDLARIGAAEELLIATRRRDGTLRNPLPVWVVRHGDALYVRSMNGPTAAWYRRALTTHDGRISAGGVDADVGFVETGDLNDQIDAAYRAKYGRRYPTIVPGIVNETARSATLRLEPRATT